ncbi:P-loop ATPase, Sll1717 family [Reyranella sp.]|uniref:P-loop ATPase, Sll1717 family n=1 Tax=Reyranella sp. TaxID=1929291 RepID=UPI003BACA1B9
MKALTFGTQVAEEETNDLAGYFVETDQWQRIAEGKIDFVRGEKGAGKSAIYSLLMAKADEFFDRGILLVAGENPRGQTVFRDLGSEPPTSEVEFIALWKLYLATIIAQRLREFSIKNAHANVAYKALEDAKLLEREFTLKGVLRRAQDYAKRIIQAEAIEGGIELDPATQMPSGVIGRIVLKEPTSDLRTAGFISADTLLAELDKAVAEAGFGIWVLLDRLDVAFTENHQLEANALRALIRVYADIRSLDHISLKIFLREDIWKRITVGGFREATHIVKVVVLDWTEPALLNLIMRRLLSNQILLSEFGIDRIDVLQDSRKQDALFARLFPPQVDQGARKLTTFKWVIGRCRDGTGKTAPREVIYLLNCVRDEEIKRLEQGGLAPSDDQLFDRSVFKLALPTVSNYRLQQYLYAEYPSERPYLEKLAGEKAEQTPAALSAIWKTDERTAIERATGLVEVGFFEKRGTRDEPTFWVPFLYRDALGLIQGKADDD